MDEDEAVLVELSSTKEQNASKTNAQIPSSVSNEPALDDDELPRSDRQLSGTTSHVQLNPAEVQKVIVEHIVKSEVASVIPSTTVIKLCLSRGEFFSPVMNIIMTLGIVILNYFLMTLLCLSYKE